MSACTILLSCYLEIISSSLGPQMRHQCLHFRCLLLVRLKSWRWRFGAALSTHWFLLPDSLRAPPGWLLAAVLSSTPGQPCDIPLPCLPTLAELNPIIPSASSLKHDPRFSLFLLSNSLPHPVMQHARRSPLPPYPFQAEHAMCQPHGHLRQGIFRRLFQPCIILIKRQVVWVVRFHPTVNSSFDIFQPTPNAISATSYEFRV